MLLNIFCDPQTSQSYRFLGRAIPLKSTNVLLLRECHICQEMGTQAPETDLDFTLKDINNLSKLLNKPVT